MAANFKIVKNSNGKAPVWKHFGFIEENGTVDKKRVGCRLCDSVLKYSSNTTNLNDHLRRKHPAINEFSTPEKSLTTTASSSTSTPKLASIFTSKIASSSPRGKTITGTIAQFIVQDLRPFSTIENPGFKNLVHILEPKYTIPSRQHFSDKLIPQIYSEVRDKLKTELKGQFVSLTTDGWTSRATESYITITSCHIDEKWELKNYVLQTRAMSESHTGINIAEVLKEAVSEWGLLPNPPIVSDNAANMIVAAKEFGTTLHVGCFAHTLNLACGRALKLNTVSKFLARMRRIVGYFHRSTTAAAILKQKQELLQLPAHKLVIDVQTRWNSALDMITRFLEQQPAIYASLTSKELRGKEKDISTLNETDISAAEELVVVLTPLKTATTVLCEENIPTLSMVLPLQHQLIFGDVYITKVEGPKSPEELCELEVIEFQKEPPIHATDNPLKWWSTHCEKYRSLALLAKHYLCIPATSVPSERVFSTAGDIITAQRSALKPEHVDRLIFLKKNWKP